MFYATVNTSISIYFIYYVILFISLLYIRSTDRPILFFIFIIIIHQILHMPFIILSMAQLAAVIQLVMLPYHWTFAAMSQVAMMTVQELTQL